MGAVRKLAQLTRAELDPVRRAALDASVFSRAGLVIPPDLPVGPQAGPDPDGAPAGRPTVLCGTYGAVRGSRPWRGPPS
ncbi:hypothetical protein ACFRJ1_01210 [Streptomyces sp. NPDC056773]|uniref:hypothetical protein n=1 Tax=unclassified Streptomyces TaxID=2593676 RepID=UPI0036CE74FB